MKTNRIKGIMKLRLYSTYKKKWKPGTNQRH